jgi:ankyrin repeat protein
VVAEALIAAGAEINSRDRNENTPLFSAAERGNTDIVRFLVAKKVNVNARQGNGYTPLIVAIRWGTEKSQIGEIARLLIDGGADVNARKPGGGWGPAGSDGQTALQQAAEFGYASVVELLIRRGADVNLAFKDGRTPLYWAVKNGHKEIIETLIRSGANVNAESSGRSALRAAREERRSEIYELLVKHGARE